jgi:hypothetical protein
MAPNKNCGNGDFSTKKLNAPLTYPEVHFENIRENLYNKS